jgi:hypothetical protein
MDPNQTLRNLTGGMSDSNNSRPKAEAPSGRFRGDEADVPVSVPPVADEPAADVPADETNPENAPTTAPEQPDEVETSPPAEVETSPPAEPETSPPAEPETSPPAEVETSPPAEVETSPPAEPETSPPAEPETSPPAEPETSPPAEPETSPPAEPETSPPAEPETSAPAETETSPEEPSAAPTEEETVGPEQTEDVTAAPEEDQETEEPQEPATEAPFDPRTEDNPTGTTTKEPTTEAPTLSPEEEAYNLDEILKPRALIPDPNPVLRLAPEECNSQSILAETVDTDDSPFDADDRTDLVWKKTIDNDTALNDFIHCNLAGPDLVIAAFCTGSPYIHVLLTRPLTVKQMTYLDELISYYQDPADYWVYYKKEDYSLDSAVANHDQEILLTTFLQPIAERDDATIISLAFVLQFWSEDDEPFEAASRMYNWSHGASVGEKTFTLNGSGTEHDPYYQKVMVNGLGGAFNTRHEHICQIYGQTSRAGTFCKIVGMQMLWGSRQQIGEILA